MAKATSPVPAGFHTVTPHLIVKGAAEYVDFLKRAFGAEELRRSPAPDGKRLMHVLVRVGDSMIMLADHFPEMGAPPIPEGSWPVTLSLYVSDCDAVWAKALQAGCSEVFPLGDQFWGDRYGQVRDPFGFVWAIATHKEEVAPEEMRARQAKAFGHS